MPTTTLNTGFIVGNASDASAMLGVRACDLEAVNSFLRLSEIEKVLYSEELAFFP